ncbi:MAG: hypothetical protein TREMPRED_000670 [Tremellales sp. Tagirdzhanova-0007]|nr:MAG: hypothetical protein TREMPRED_000670 [Tremellales sp. Tagirdzhanova-0007]
MGLPLQVPQDLIGSSGLYNSPDPILRRLRLEDTTGHSITDIDRYFRGKELLVLYAGSEQGAVNLKELHRNLTTLALRELKRCSVIYVSTDTDPTRLQRVLANVPWLRMTFHDNSDFALSNSGKEVEMEEVARGEEFVQAGEIEIGVESVGFGMEEYQLDYVRPLSRAAVTSLMTAYATPSIAIYHIGSHSFISKNVKLSAFLATNVDKNMHTWRNGGTSSMRIIDVMFLLRWPIIALILAALYHLMVLIGGENYNVIPRALDSMSWRVREAGGRVL